MNDNNWKIGWLLLEAYRFQSSLCYGSKPCSKRKTYFPCTAQLTSRLAPRNLPPGLVVGLPAQGAVPTYNDVNAVLRQWEWRSTSPKPPKMRKERLCPLQRLTTSTCLHTTLHMILELEIGEVEVRVDCIASSVVFVWLRLPSWWLAKSSFGLASVV